MTETPGTIRPLLTETCYKDLADYKRAVKSVQSQAIRKLIESIIAQKTDQLSDLRSVMGSQPDGSDASRVAADSTPETWADMELLLAAITTRENTFAEAIRALASKAELEEHRNTLNACADRSRKFSSWTQDHLDLLNLF